MRISDWSSDVCSSDLTRGIALGRALEQPQADRPLEQKSRRRGDRHDQQREKRQAPAFGHSSSPTRFFHPATGKGDRKSVVSGKSVSVRVDLGGRRIIQKNTHYITSASRTIYYSTD